MQALRKTYLNKGKLSVCRDAQGKPYVELVEALRVFPHFAPSGADGEVAGNPVAAGFAQLQQRHDVLLQEVQALQQRLHSETQQRHNAEEREAWLRNHVDTLTAENAKLLAGPQWTAPEKKRSWFARLAGR